MSHKQIIGIGLIFDFRIFGLDFDLDWMFSYFLIFSFCLFEENKKTKQQNKQTKQNKTKNKKNTTKLKK